MPKDPKGEIEAREDGPYIASNIVDLRTSRGEQARTAKTLVLCRCGKSGAKPHCDGTHARIGFSSRKIEGRQPDRVDDYAGRAITIHDNRGVCSHAGHCTNNLPSVFRMGTEPWIDPGGAEADEIIRVIEMCPSGALSYTVDGVKHDSRARQPAVALSKNGPYRIVGRIALQDDGGSSPLSEEHFTLCRCGGSKNKPFCDGTHWYIKFEDDEIEVPLANREPETIEEYLGNIKRKDDRFEEVMADIHEISVTGKSITEPMRTTRSVIGWDEILIKGAQLNSLPLNDDVPVSTKTVIGPKAEQPMVIETPIYVTHMSFGALSRETKIALAKGSAAVQTAMCSGEGGIIPESMQAAHKYVFEYVPNRYSATDENLRQVDAIEMKIGQSAKPGMGGHLPGNKATKEISALRGFPEGTDIISPAHFDDILDRNDLKRTVQVLREKSGGRPIGIKFAAGNIEQDLAVAVFAEPDFITIDGRPGATGAAPKFVKAATSVPTLFALHRARKYLDQHAPDISLCITGGFRISPDFAKALAMGADAIAIGTAALMATACQQYRLCHTGDCPVGVTTQREELRERFHVDHSAQKLANFLRVSTDELRAFARLTGNHSVHELAPSDLVTTNSEISKHTNIEHA